MLWALSNIFDECNALMFAVLWVAFWVTLSCIGLHWIASSLRMVWMLGDDLAVFALVDVCTSNMRRAHWAHWTHLGKPQQRNISVHFGIARLGGVGGLNPCQDGLGHLFRGELSKYKHAFWGGQKACQDGLGHLFYRRIFTGGLPIQNWAKK